MIRDQIDNKVPGTSEAFEKLLKDQHPVYHSHEKMEDSKVEEIRYSLLETRREDVRTLDMFISILSNTKRTFRNMQ